MLSVIVPTRDRPVLLDRMLGSLATQTLPDNEFEVIVVDNGSQADTAAVVAKHRGRLPELRRVAEAEPGLHRARHRGLDAARSELLVFADDDIFAGPQWLASYRRVLEDPRVAMAGGNNLPDFASPPPAWLQAHWELGDSGQRALGALSILDLGRGSRPIDPGLIWGCNFAVRRQLVVDAGGFHPDALPPDRVLFRGDGETHISNHVRRQGLLAWFDSDASVHHRVSAARMSPDYLRRRHFAQGISDSYARIRERGRAPGRAEGAYWLLRHQRARARLALRPWLLRHREPMRRQLERLRQDWRCAYFAGIRAHVQACTQDPALLAWVLRESYL